MPGRKKPGPSIKNPAQYEDLKQKGFSKSEAAAISNASFNKSHGKEKTVAKKGGIANFGGKKAAPFGKRKSSATSRKKSSTKTAAGTRKKRGG